MNFITMQAGPAGIHPASNEKIEGVGASEKTARKGGGGRVSGQNTKCGGWREEKVPVETHFLGGRWWRWRWLHAGNGGGGGSEHRRRKEIRFTREKWKTETARHI